MRRLQKGFRSGRPHCCHANRSCAAVADWQVRQFQQIPSTPRRQESCRSSVRPCPPNRAVVPSTLHQPKQQQLLEGQAIVPTSMSARKAAEARWAPYALIPQYLYSSSIGCGGNDLRCSSLNHLTSFVKPSPHAVKSVLSRATLSWRAWTEAIPNKREHLLSVKKPRLIVSFRPSFWTTDKRPNTNIILACYPRNFLIQRMYRLQ